MFSVTQRAAASAQRIFEILDRVPSVAEPAVPVDPENLRGEIELRGVGFRYGNRHGDRKLQPEDRAGRNDRAGRAQRIGQEHAGESGLPVLRRHAKDRSASMASTSGHFPCPISPADRHRAARAVPVLRHDGRKHRLWPARGHARGRSSPRPAARRPTNSSCACRMATTRWWASAAVAFGYLITPSLFYYGRRSRTG